jgi:hypothetical protein
VNLFIQKINEIKKKRINSIKLKRREEEKKEKKIENSG